MTTATLSLASFSFESSELFNGNKQDKVFKKWLIILFLIYLLVGLLVPLFERPVVSREVKEQMPPQLTKIILKKKEEPKEKPIEPEKIEVKEEPKEIEPPKTKRAVAKEKAKSSGLAAMKDDLFALRDAFTVTPKTVALKKNESNVTEPVKRNLLAAKANEKSKSLQAVKTITTAASDKLATKNTQQVRLAAEEIIADGIDQNSTETGEQLTSNTRSELKLRQTLEANKARLYALYNRALRKDPFLSGKVLFEIEILPDGSVSQVSIQSSALENKKLERQLVLAMKKLNFGAENVDVMTTIWAVEFLPR